MKLAQSLYASGWISYMRTDNPNPDPQSLSQLRQFIEQQGLPLSAKPNVWRSSKDAQEGHECIHPMELDKPELQIDECQDKHASDQIRLYRLIYERFVASQMADAEFDQTRILLQGDVQLAGQSVQFLASGRVPTCNQGWRGWLKSDPNDNDDKKSDDDAENRSLLPDSIKVGHRYVCECQLQVKKTKPPVLYSEASLIKALKRKGIGRPSTYASIIQTLFRHQYVKLEKRKLVPTEMGIKIIERLLAMGLAFMEYQYTAQMETWLDAIARQKKRYLDVVSQVHSDILIDLESLSEDLKTPLKQRTEAQAIGECRLCEQGRVLEREKNYRCDHCQATLWKLSFGKRIGKKLAVELFSGKTVFIEKLKSKKTQKHYNAHGRMSEGKLTLIFDQHTTNDQKCMFENH